MELITIFIAIIIIFTTAFLLHVFKYRSYVKSLGLPIDNKVVWFHQTVDFKKRDVDCMKKFGKIWIDYSTTVPTIVIGDPEVIKEVMVKHFDSFVNRTYYGVEEQHMSLIDAR